MLAGVASMTETMQISVPTLAWTCNGIYVLDIYIVTSAATILHLQCMKKAWTVERLEASEYFCSGECLEQGAPFLLTRHIGYIASNFGHRSNI